MGNKILIGVGFLLTCILLIENMVQPLPYLFIWSTTTWKLSLVSIIIGIGVGYGIKGFMIGDKEFDEGNF